MKNCLLCAWNLYCNAGSAFDPIKRAKDVEELVMQSLARKYCRFRPAKYYGGIATADLVGCPFLRAYCWNYGRNLHPELSRDRYYSP